MGCWRVAGGFDRGFGGQGLGAFGLQGSWRLRLGALDPERLHESAGEEITKHL